VLTLVILYLGLFSTLAAHIARSLFQLTKKVVRPLIRAWFLRVVPARETTGCRENLRAPLPDRQKTCAYLLTGFPKYRHAREY